MFITQLVSQTCISNLAFVNTNPTPIFSNSALVSNLVVTHIYNLMRGRRNLNFELLFLWWATARKTKKLIVFRHISKLKAYHTDNLWLHMALSPSYSWDMVPRLTTKYICKRLVYTWSLCPYKYHFKWTLSLNYSITLIGKKTNTTYYPKHSSTLSFGHEMEDISNSTKRMIYMIKGQKPREEERRRRKLGWVFCSNVLLVISLKDACKSICSMQAMVCEK